MKPYLTLVAAFLLMTSSASAVERESSTDEREPARDREYSARLGYEAESALKSEAGGKSFFYLSNDVAWPEKITLSPAAAAIKPQTGQPATAPKTPSTPDAPKPQAREAAADTITPDAPAAAPAGRKNTSGAAKVTAPSKPKPVKKQVALPDIEEILEDVRRSARPKMPADRLPDAPAADAAAPAATYSEVVGTVDMDDLARDLAALQSSEPSPQPVARPKHETQDAAGANWWILTAAVSGTAGAIVLGISLARRLRRPKIRTQGQIDTETRAFFSRLAAERRQSGDAAPMPARRERVMQARGPILRAKHDAQSQADVEMEEAFSDETDPVAAAAPRQTVAQVQQMEPAVYQLPAELDNDSYKDVIQLAAAGEPAAAIADRLSMGEGEVRLVLDLARLSHERTGAY